MLVGKPATQNKTKQTQQINQPTNQNPCIFNLLLRTYMCIQINKPCVRKQISQGPALLITKSWQRVRDAWITRTADFTSFFPLLSHSWPAIPMYLLWSLYVYVHTVLVPAVLRICTEYWMYIHTYKLISAERVAKRVIGLVLVSLSRWYHRIPSEEGSMSFH